MIVQITDLDEILSLLKTFKESMYNCSGVNFDDWSKKLYTSGYVLAYKDKNVKGLIGFYCNDKSGKKAFISTIVVDKNYQRQGIAKLLLDEMCKISLKNEMREINLKVHNKNIIALKFYEKYGFNFIANENEYMLLHKNII